MILLISGGGFVDKFGELIELKAGNGSELIEEIIIGDWVVCNFTVAGIVGCAFVVNASATFGIAAAAVLPVVMMPDDGIVLIVTFFFGVATIGIAAVINGTVDDVSDNFDGADELINRISDEHSAVTATFSVVDVVVVADSVVFGVNGLIFGFRFICFLCLLTPWNC